MASIFHSLLLCFLIGFSSLARAQSEGASPDRCVDFAAEYHGVNNVILRSILNVESYMNEKIVTRNSNGSIDVGIAGINSIHFKELSRYGITPEHLLDACISTYVAAWNLSKKINRWGNNWFGVAAYHSTTPYYNYRYQVILHNEMVKSGSIQGNRLAVPPLKQK